MQGDDLRQIAHPGNVDDENLLRHQRVTSRICGFGLGCLASRRPELPCVACVLFFPNDLSGHRFKHHFLSFLILDVV